MLKHEEHKAENREVEGLLEDIYLSFGSVMIIRYFVSSDAIEIADLFHGSVHSINTDIYSKEQLSAWSPAPLNYNVWAARLERTQPFIATINNIIVGFLELRLDGHIDCMYVHSNYQRQGIASALFAHACNEAIKSGCQCLFVEASIVAKAFFLKKGFDLVSENTVEKEGQKLINYSMRRDNIRDLRES